jgi:16S rRNA (guanine527-N7)-methyltransferase
MDALKTYVTILKKWSKKMNLCRDIERLWTYHIPCCQNFVSTVEQYTSSKDPIVDLGSGNGMPGIFFVLQGYQNVHMIESNGKKASFLKFVLSELSMKATVHHDRIENILPMLPHHYVVARALASLSQLIDWMKPHTEGFFLKGEHLMDEIKEAQKHHHFDFAILKHCVHVHHKKTIPNLG